MKRHSRATANRPRRLDRAPAVFVLAALLLLSGCTRFDVLNATVPSCGYLRTTDIPYGPLPRQKLDVYTPKGATSNGALPGARVVVFFYGGDWQAGNKGDYRFAAEAITSQGFVAVMPDYRLYPEATFPAFVEDGALAVRWVHDNASRFGGDARYVYLMGHSAGAHIAALLTLDAHYLRDAGLDRRAVAATAALSGPYDFYPADYDLPVFSLKPGERIKDQRMEPINFADGTAPPMLLVTGLEDTTVEPGNAKRLAARIRQHGGIVELITYPDRGHVGVVLSLAGAFRWLAPTLRDTAAFFREH